MDQIKENQKEMSPAAQNDANAEFDTRGLLNWSLKSYIKQNFVNHNYVVQFATYTAVKWKLLTFAYLVKNICKVIQ